MSKKFTDQEKAYIRQRLIEEGKKLFEIFGLMKTNIGELTKSVGIAQGSFYNFFMSKEELYYEIIEQEEAKVQNQLTEVLINKTLTKDRFAQFLHLGIKSLDENPILSQLYDERVMQQLSRKLPVEKLALNADKDLSFFAPFITDWQEAGVMKKIDPEVIVSMIRSLILLSLQKKYIGEANFEETMTQFIQMMADGLVIEEASTHD